MELARLTVRVQAGEAVGALYAGDRLSGPPALYVKVGDICLIGTPATVVDTLGRALQECYVAWGQAQQAGDSSVARSSRQDTPLPPTGDQAEVGDTLSRLAPRATAKPLGLDGGARISDPLARGGTDKTRLYLVREGVERDG